MNIGRLVWKWRNREALGKKDKSYYCDKWCNDRNNAFYGRADVWNKIDELCETQSMDEVLRWSMKELGIKSHIFSETTTETKKKQVIGNFDLSLLKDYPTYDNSTYAKKKMKQLNETLDNFFIKATVVNYRDSFSQICYDVRLEANTTVNQVKNRKEDIRVHLDVNTIDFSHSNGYLHVIIPTEKKSIVGLKNVLESNRKIPLGIDLEGNVITMNFDRDKHLLIGGATGGGKTVFIHSLLCSLLFYYSNLRLFLADFKGVSLPKYNNTPYLLKPCITSENDFIEALEYCKEEMAKREEIFRQRNIEELPKDMERIVFIVDELEDVIYNDEIRGRMVELLRKSRAFGIHFILATQTTTKKVIPTDLRNNIPSRIAFKVDDENLSEAILGRKGAEELSGEGDMYFKNGKGEVTRLQGAYITVEEVLKVTKALEGESNYIKVEVKKELDELFYEFGKFCIKEGKASEKLFRDTYTNNYPRATKIINQLREEEVISEYDSSERKSHILMSLDEFERRYGK